ncbi:MAG TPA: hypothetical protein VGM27_10920 [Acidobacteriaceae bacterium]
MAHKEVNQPHSCTSRAEFGFCLTKFPLTSFLADRLVADRFGRLAAFFFVAALLCARPAHAHVGSPDVYAEGQAGPYKVFVTLQPPLVIPGVARVEVRTSARQIDKIEIAPMPLTGEAAKHPPVPEMMQRSPDDPDFYTGNLWMMASGSWQVRFLVSGRLGTGELRVPIAATPTAILKMQPMLGAGLFILGALLVLGMVGIVGASVRDAQFAPGIPIPDVRKSARWAMTAALVVLLLAAWLGNKWWNVEAAIYAGNVYQPIAMQASLKTGEKAGEVLDLSLADPASGRQSWMRRRSLDDFILDHDHLMHLYAIREPQMDVVFHLHPTRVAPGEFRLPLPSMPAGAYRLYADVVHADGFPETMVARVTVPKLAGRALSGDDAEGTAPPLESTGMKSAETNFRLPDGYQMVWARPPVLRARRPQVFTFYLLDPQGRPPSNMALYMGMLGHAAFIRSDGAVFAHIHPSGTPAMAAMMLAQPAGNGASNMPAPMDMTMSMPMTSGDSANGALPNKVGFPYGFPTPGKYRIFVQMKHGDTIETGSFDADVPQ